MTNEMFTEPDGRVFKMCSIQRSRRRRIEYRSVRGMLVVSVGEATESTESSEVINVRVEEVLKFIPVSLNHNHRQRIYKIL